jgi:hypothetical protein
LWPSDIFYAHLVSFSPFATRKIWQPWTAFGGEKLMLGVGFSWSSGIVGQFTYQMVYLRNKKSQFG